MLEPNETELREAALAMRGFVITTKNDRGEPAALLAKGRNAYMMSDQHGYRRIVPLYRADIISLSIEWARFRRLSVDEIIPAYQPNHVHQLGAA